MAIGKFTKQPADILDFDVDFGSEFFASYGGDSIPNDGSITVTITSGNTGGAGDLVLGPDARPDFVRISDQEVKVWVGAGTTGTTYKVTVVVDTGDSRRKETEVEVKVKER